MGNERNLDIVYSISLLQHGLNIHLSWGFANFVEFYRGAVGPVLDILLWPVRALLRWFHVQWIIPQWAKDLWALSFLGANVFWRALEAPPVWSRT